jgi:hypothetical protein
MISGRKIPRTEPTTEIEMRAKIREPEPVEESDQGDAERGQEQDRPSEGQATAAAAKANGSRTSPLRSVDELLGVSIR